MGPDKIINRFSILMLMSLLASCASLQQSGTSVKTSNRNDARKAGEIFADCRGCPKMVVVPAGKFLMGSAATEPGRYRIEGPAHDVTIAHRFAVGIQEVTWAQWELCVAEKACSTAAQVAAGDDKGWGKGDLPVINVSFADAEAFAAWLSKKTGKNYRLLSEAEWEYVARAGTVTAFNTGPQITTSQASFDGKEAYDGGAIGESRQKTTAAGAFRPNAFGVYDVHGNLWEWVQDCFSVTYDGAPTDGSAWKGGDCTYRVTRGGSWANTARKVRSAMRDRDKPAVRNQYYGIRVARDLA